MKGTIIDEQSYLTVGKNGTEVVAFSIVLANGGRLYRGDIYENRGIGDTYEFNNFRRSKEVIQNFNVDMGSFSYVSVVS